MRAPRWNAFATRLAEAQRRGLRSLGEDGVRTFVADYRDLAADLARLRTATRGASQAEVFYLSRLVAGAHNLLYRGRSLTLVQVVRYFMVDVPREIRRSWFPITIAAALLFLPMLVASVAVMRNPEVAATLLPPGMLDRAEDGVRRAATEGEGYIDIPEVFRPVMASQIIANNVQVSYVAFASGVAAGVPTVLLLAMNGISIGAVFGLYASKGIFNLILAFVAPHGVLELFAICVAGGGGLLLAGALLVPGTRTRRMALVEDGARAIRLIAGVTLLLLVAGTIEGMISPIPWWPLEGKLAVSGVTAVLLYLYLRSGSVAVRDSID
ncbi:MAG: stage II sporulation protein M [Gemmatimonadaceae bacterium]|nr:stage II sporulation protein M [Gemmatimonadaceae bacterium]